MTSSTIDVQDHHGSGSSQRIEGARQANVVGSRIRASVEQNEQDYFGTQGEDQVLTAAGQQRWAEYQRWERRHCDDQGCRGDSGLSDQARMWMSMIADDEHVYDIHPLDLRALPSWVTERVLGTRFAGGDSRPFTVVGSEGLNECRSVRYESPVNLEKRGSECVA